MLRLLPLSILLLTLTAACSRSTAGLTIPARQTFLLGEYEQNNYRANLDNEGRQTVTAQLIDKETKDVLESTVVEPGEQAALQVEDGQMIYLINDNDGKAQLLVRMSTNVEGMRFLDVETEPSTSPANGESAEALNPEKTGKPHKMIVEVPGGQEAIIGESAGGGYAARVRSGKSGGPIAVSVRRGPAGEQTQGFGLGRGSGAEIYVREGETLVLVNEGPESCRVTLKTSAKLADKRLQATR